MTVLGRALFWPSKKYLQEPEAARFAAVGRSLGRHPGRFALASGGVLAVLTLFAFTFNPTFDLGSSGTSSTAESAVALKTLEKGYPAGATDPTIVLLHSTDDQALGQDAMTEFGTALSSVKGVASVGPPTPSKDGLTATYSVLPRR